MNEYRRKALEELMEEDGVPQNIVVKRDPMKGFVPDENVMNDALGEAPVQQPSPTTWERIKNFFQSNICIG